MDQHFSKIGEVHTMLQEAKIGLWCVEYDKDKPPRLYADDTFLSMMGISKHLSPEESYRIWEDQIPSYEKERATAYMNAMINGEHSEIEYAWQHPEKGLMYIRCCGDLDKSYTQGARVHGCHQDITDVVQVQQTIETKLKETQQGYARLNKDDQRKQKILNTIPGGVAVIKQDASGVWSPEFMSEGFADMVGMSLMQLWLLYKEDAMTGVHPDDRAKLGRELAEYIHNEEDSREFIYRLIRGDGSYVWVRNTINSMTSEDGVRRNYCVYRDITNELEEKEQLRAKYRELLASHYHGLGHDMLLVGHCNITRNKMLEVVDNQNKDLLAMLGDDRETFVKFIGKYIVSDVDRQEFLAFALNEPLLEAYAQGKREVSHIYFVKSPLEEHGRYAQFKVTMMQNPDTDDIMGVLSITDATEQTINRKIVRKMSVLGADRITDIDLIHGTRTVLYAGRIHGAIIGRKGAYTDFLSNSVERHVVPEDREQWLAYLQPEYIEHQLQDKDSYSFTYSVYKNPHFPPKVKMATVTAIDMRLGRVCMARTDITASVEAERRSKEALEAALLEAEQANRAKSEFLSNVSHDIRTPMNAIMGMTSIAMDNLENGNDPQELRKCLENIVVSSKHLLGLINNVLDMSKIEAGKLVLNREHVSLRQLVKNIVTTMQSQITAKRQELVLDVGELNCAGIYSDGVRLHQVLLNLLGNAVKFTPVGGKVAFSLQEEASPKGKNYVRLRFGVKDNGIGMTDEFVQHIFESFAREDNRRVQKIEGTGLGMAITKYIIDAMHGTIAVHSKPNQGTEFTIVLDVERGHRCGESYAPQKKNEVHLEGLKVLLAEDNELNREIAVALLERKGIIVDAVENGQICVDKFKAAPLGYYDAVLMDLRMPVMNGYEATKAIRALDRDDAKLPIIAMTADAFAEDMQHCLEVGMNAHMAKPIDIDKLMDMLAQLCG
ncbi:MAG: ATP-binding protein [Phascolarctobacterium sp.]